MTKSDLCSLRRKWPTIEKEGSAWKSFEDFAHWAESAGYALGKNLYKLNESEIHGPQNSYWYMQRDDLPDVVSPFCEGCTRICPKHGAGCFEWRAYWIKNWDQVICGRIQEKPEEVPKVNKKQYFRYEHPDLMRELPEMSSI